MKASIYQLAVPMLRSFGHAEKSRCMAESVIFKFEYNGCTGIGEGAPRQYVTGETVESVVATIAKLNPNKIATMLDFSSLSNACDSIINFGELFKVTNNARCAVEMALLDLIGRYFNCSLSTMLGQTLVTEIPTSQVLDFSLSVEEFLHTRGPFYYIKIKVGDDIQENINRVGAVRAAVGAGVPIAVDANMAWDLERAVAMVQALQRFNVGYYEEPLPKGAFTEYHTLRELTGAKILLDESVCSSVDAAEAITNQAVDAFNIRIAKCGGILSVIELIKMTREHNLNFQLGAQVAEVGPLVAAGRHLAAATNGYFTFEGGQADRFFVKENYIVTPMPAIARATNLAAVPNGYGLGVALNSNIEKFAVTALQWVEGRWQ